MPAISQSIHSGTVVKSIIYDTSKDSDGGAWRKRCTDKSWFTETLGGNRWIGQAADEFTARCIAAGTGSNPNLVVNGGFDTDTNWTKGAGWTVGSGVLSATSVADSVTATQGMSAAAVGVTYAITFTVTGRSSGGVRINRGGAFSPTFSVDGTHTCYVTAINTGTTLGIWPVGVTTLNIDNISVKLVDTTASAAGYVYQSTAAGTKYYSLTGASGQTEVFRGIAREFPEQVAIVAETARVVIYDLTVPGCPMWMVIRSSDSNMLFSDGYGFRATSVAAINGQIFAFCTQTSGLEAGMYGGGLVFEFINDSILKIGGAHSSATGVGRKNWSSLLNTLYQFFKGTGPQLKLVNGWVNDVAVTVLEGAPIDPATGLPVPTVAVATAGGVSVIKHDGTVVNSALTTNCITLGIDAQFRLIFWVSGVANYCGKIGSLPSGFNGAYMSSTSVPALLRFDKAFTAMRQSTNAHGGSGVDIYASNPTTPTKGMVAAITNAYNSGYQVGDSRFAGLADTVAETITAPELVVSPFTLGDAASIITNSAVLRVENGDASAAYTAPNASVVIGKTYEITCNLITKPASSGARFLFGGSDTGANLVVGPIRRIFTASTTSGLQLTNGSSAVLSEYSEWGSISVKLADPDRSVKANSLSIVGTLNKTAVASGAQLVAYSGFTAANYLEQPYSANLDFGTGEFDLGAWVNVPATNTIAAAIAAWGGLGAPLATTGTYNGYNSSAITNGGVLPSQTTSNGVGNYGFQIANTLTIGVTYKATLSWSGNSFGRNISLDGGLGSVLSNATSGTATYLFKAAVTHHYIYIIGAASAGETFTAVSCTMEPVTGILPMLDRSGLSNLAWPSACTQAVVNATNTSGFVVPTGASGTTRNMRFGATTQAVSVPHTIFIRAKPEGYTRFRFWFSNTGAGANFNLSAGTFQIGGTTNVSMTLESDGYWLCSCTYSQPTVAGGEVRVYVTDPNTGVDIWVATPDGVSGVRFKDAGLFQGSYTAAQIQALGGIPLTTTVAGPPKPAIYLGVDASARPVGIVSDGTTTRTVTGATSIATGLPTLLALNYKTTGAVELVVNDAVVATATGAALLTMNNNVAQLTVGNSLTKTRPWQGSISMLTASATVASTDQRGQIYRDELAMFQPNAQCTIAGTSTAVTALAYDESTDLLHVGTSWGRSAFKGLLRTESEATTTGAITSISAAQGAILTGGTSAKIWQPALLLRDELARKEEARRALGKVPVFIDFTATASQTAFVLAIGYTVKALYRNGVLMRETTTGVFWTRSFDGYRETATLSVGATVGDWISLMCIRNN